LIDSGTLNLSTYNIANLDDITQVYNLGTGYALIANNPISGVAIDADTTFTLATANTQYRFGIMYTPAS